MKYRVSLFGRKLGAKGMFAMLPWQEVEAKSHDEAIEIVTSNLKDTHECPGFYRSEVVKLPIIIPFMSMPDTAFAVGPYIYNNASLYGEQCN